MPKSDRLLLILNLLRSRRKLKTSDLAKECEVSERTIYRYIQALSEARVPIYFDDGYKLLTDAFLPPLNFTIDELLTFYVGLNSDPIQSVHCLRKTAKQTLAKIESLIPEKARNDYETTKKQIAIQTKQKPSDRKASLMFELLWQAIKSKREIKISCGSGDFVESIELLPQALHYKKGAWYLVGQKQNKLVHFRLDRVKKVAYS